MIQISSSYSKSGSHAPDILEWQRHFTTTLVHENGHHVVVDRLGTTRENQNVQWLKDETKHDSKTNYTWWKSSINEGKTKGIAPSDEQPDLLWRGYSYKVYDEEDQNPGQPGADATYEATELISTGFEALVADPDVFLRGFPNHANLILDNLKGLR